MLGLVEREIVHIMQKRPDDQPKSQFEDHLGRNLLLGFAAIAFLFFVSYFSAQLDTPARQLVFVIGLAMLAFAPRLVRAAFRQRH